MAIADDITNGTVEVEPTSAQAGDIVTLTVNPADGYVLDALTVTAENATAPTPVETNGKYTFTMPASNVTVRATLPLATIAETAVAITVHQATLLQLRVLFAAT